jgi:integrase
MAIHEKVKSGNKFRFAVQVSAYHPVTKKRHFRRGQARHKWEAQELERTLLQKLKESFSQKQIPSWKELLKSYEEQILANKAASTRHNELSIFGHHATPKLELKLVNQITEADIRDILNSVAPDRSLSLKHNIRKCLSNVFNYALDNRFVTENPCRAIRLPKIPDPQLNILDEKEIRTFLKKAEESGVEWFPVWAFAIYTGLRSGELFALRYRHIHDNKGQIVIKVQESWTKQGGYKPHTKNKMIRTVPLNKEAQRIIALLKTANPDKCNPDDFILPQIPTWKQGDAAKDLRAFLSGCGLQAIRFHDLRACFITQCLWNGVQPTVVMKLVGHADLKVLMRYCRHTGSDLLGQTDVLDFS